MRGWQKTGLAALLAALMAFCGIGAASAARFEARYWPAFGENVYALEPGGGRGDYVALTTGGDLMAFIRRERADAPACALSLYDLGVAKTLAARPLPTPDEWADDWTLGFWAPGQPYTLHSNTLTLTVYDQALEEVLSFTPPEDFSLALADPAGQALWCASYSGPDLTRFDLITGEVRVFPTGLGEAWFVMGFAGLMPQGGVLAVLGSSRGEDVFFAADKEGRTQLKPVISGFTWTTGGLCYAAQAGDALVMPAWGEDRLVRLASWEAEEYVLGFDQGLLITEAYGESAAWRLIDLDQGLVTAQLKAPPEDMPVYFSQFVLSPEGFALLSSNQYELNRYNLYLWDYSRAPLNAPAGARESSLSQLRAENDALALDIARQHGIQLHIRQAGARFLNDTYYAQHLDQEPALTHTLRSLQEQLDRFPPGMLMEAVQPGHDSIAIYLAGGIRPKSPEGIHSPGGFASASGNERYIALDITQNGARSLAHELMHLFEDRLEQSPGPGERDVLADWLALGPLEAAAAGFFYSYHDEEGWEVSDTRYTADAPEAWENPEDIWFIDAYSRAFPLEDRARIFETLFLAGDTPSFYLEAPHLLRKAQYLCAILRERFDSLKDAPTLHWERHLTPLPYADFLEEFEALNLPVIPMGRLARPFALC